jgi:rSAM/selenodomain-associated transferase 1
VVAKQPAPGQTKTRLTPALTGEQASALYECFLLDTLEIIRTARTQLALTPIIAYLPPDGEAYFRRIAPDFELLLQEGDDLSERLHNATRHCLTQGYDRAVIMDSDSPSLPAAHLVEAFTALETADVSLGACDDGGYYLIGLKQPAPSLFLTVTMSTDHVTADTLDRAAQAGLSLHHLAVHYDIDYVSDLKRLIDELGQLPDNIAPHTRAFLQTNSIGITI